MNSYALKYALIITWITSLQYPESTSRPTIVYVQRLNCLLFANFGLFILGSEANLNCNFSSYCIYCIVYQWCSSKK